MKKLLTLQLFLVCAVNGAQTGSLPTERFTALRDLISAHCKDNEIVGCSLAVAAGDKIVFSEAFGFADLENQVPARPETVYRLASISKTLTATCVMRLVEDGLVDLDTDIRKYLPEFPEKEFTVTVRQILCHQSGIRHYKGNEFDSMKPYASIEESVGIFKDDPLEFKPRTKYLYSTYGYSLLARLVEKVSGKSFYNYLYDKVLFEAQMLKTRIDNPREIIPNRARGYVKTARSEIQNSAYADTSYKTGGGGILSTADDLCKFGIALQKHTLLKPQFQQEMWTSQPLADGTDTSYGLGWEIQKIRGIPWYLHTGAQQGSRTVFCVCPSKSLVIAILTNYESHNISEFSKKIMRFLLESEGK